MAENNNVLHEYLASLGVEFDKKGLDDAVKAFRKMEKDINSIKLASVTTAFIELGRAIYSTTGKVLQGAESIVKFGESIAFADQEVEIFARRMLTTERNARSLKAVMDAMHIDNIEQLKDVNLNPELRKQFLGLRDLTKGLEPNAGQQAGLANIRGFFYEFQKFSVLVTYFFQKTAGYIGQYIQPILKPWTDAIHQFEAFSKGHLDEWAKKTAEIFAQLTQIFVAVTDFAIFLGRAFFDPIFRIFKLFDALPQRIKIWGSLLIEVGAALLAGPWGAIIAGIAELGLLIEDYAVFKKGGKSAFPGIWEKLDDFSAWISQGLQYLASINESLVAIADHFGVGPQAKFGIGLAGLGMGGPIINGALGNLASNITQGVVGHKITKQESNAINSILPYVAASLFGQSGKLSIQKGAHAQPAAITAASQIAALAGNITLTSGDERGGAGHDPGKPGSHSSHKSGYKFDIGLGGKTDNQVAGIIRAALTVPNIAQVGAEFDQKMDPKKYGRVLAILKDQGIDTSRLSNFSDARHSGDNLDVRLKNLNVVINVNGAGDPHATAKAVKTSLKTAVNTRAVQGSHL